MPRWRGTAERFARVPRRPVAACGRHRSSRVVRSCKQSGKHRFAESFLVACEGGDGGKEGAVGHGPLHDVMGAWRPAEQDGNSGCIATCWG